MEVHFLTKGHWRRFDFADGALRDLGSPIPVRAEVPGELGEADGLVFAQEGDGPSFDLCVQDQAGQRLVVTGTHLTRTNFCHVPVLDAVMFVDGDPGTSTSRAFPAFALDAIRARLGDGGDVDARALNHFRVQAAVNGIDPESPNLRFCAVAGSPEFVLYWNTPMANPPSAGISVVEWYRYQPGESLRAATRRISKPSQLDNFWVHEVLAGRRANGDLVLGAVGIGRKRRDFLLEVRVYVVEGGADALCSVMRGEPVIHRINGVSLRHNASVLALAAVPDGLIGVFEAPNRSTRLLHIAFDAHGYEVRELDKPCPIQAIRSFAEPPLLPEPEAEVEAEEHDSELVSVGPGEVAIAAGEFPARAEVVARVYVVGDGAGAKVHHWLSQAPGEGEVPYTLHVSAARAVQVRYDVDHFE